MSRKGKDHMTVERFKWVDGKLYNIEPVLPNERPSCEINKENIIVAKDEKYLIIKVDLEFLKENEVKMETIDKKISFENVDGDVIADISFINSQD